MRIVVKIGTSTLTHPTGNLNIRRVEQLVKVLSDLKNAGNELIIVTSGAIGMGVGKLSLPERPKDMPTKQAAAAVGQCELMYTYDKFFSEYHCTVAQLLITRADVEHPICSQNFRSTLFRLLALGALPIINENDVVATDEIGAENTIGENDTLSAFVAVSVNADLLVLLSDIDGLYTADPHRDPKARLITEVRDLTDDILAAAGGNFTAQGTGGMRTKLHAAQMCCEAGCDTLILNGAKPLLLYDLIDGKSVGTRFIARRDAR